MISLANSKCLTIYSVGVAVGEKILLYIYKMQTGTIPVWWEWQYLVEIHMCCWRISSKNMMADWPMGWTWALGDNPLSPLSLECAFCSPFLLLDIALRSKL